MSLFVLKHLLRTFLIASVSLLTACSGGGGGDGDESEHIVWPTTNPAGASTFSGATAAYQGSISGIGSIVVNGVRFETTDSVVYDSDDFSTSYGYNNNTSTFSSPLALGMTVALYGDVDDAQSLGRAYRIRIVGGVRGTINAITASTIDLPTQVIQINASTTYGGITVNGTAVTTYAELAALANTQPLITAYGLTQTDGSFLASRVVVSNSATHVYDVAVRGTITAIAGSTYTVKTAANSSISVDCSACTIQPSLVNTPVLGDEVRALSFSAANWNGTTLVTDRLQLINPFYLTSFNGATTASTYAKIKGVATQSNGNWYVGGVQVSGATLTANTLYEIRGTWSGSVLQASSVEI